MNKHYDNYLTNKYSPLYRDRCANMQTTCMCWGFCVGDGWFNIINTLSWKLCKDWLIAKERYDKVVGRVGELMYPDVKESAWNSRITQESIDSLKNLMDDEYNKAPTAVQVKEKFGTLRFYVDGVSAEQLAYVEFAESLSAVTCEVCGAPGKLNSMGWIKCRCKEHTES